MENISEFKALMWSTVMLTVTSYERHDVLHHRQLNNLYRFCEGNPPVAALTEDQ